ncbi:hypothetical protein LF1_26080 [Rubripirellula obstinata]|uniref:Tetratricopeptide repeat protein n=1 Tax=Rubripirellula obstinata TaxID=406547 RepID=A0A5B1CK12_9BACT|nr:hypothetical protein [Rubripirellula obstinata]KAA1260069.1 hypothetical protein LF1_26080 [Rubripirellula obstinata]
MNSSAQLSTANRDQSTQLGAVAGKILIALMVGCGLFFSTTIAFAQHAEFTDEDFAKLSEGDYATRHQATMNMWKNRDRSRNAVQRAARNEDPEIAGRAKWILRKWRLGALPDTPPELSRLLDDGDGQSAILRLIENGQFGAAVVAVEESAGTPAREAISRRVTAAVTQRFPVYAQLAMKSQSVTQLLKLIDLVAETPEMSLCRIRLMQHLDLPIDDENLLPKSSSAWPEIQQQQTRIALLVELGQFDAAIEIGIQSNNPELIRRCQMIAGDWQGLKNDAYQSATRMERNTDENDSVAMWKHWSDVLVAASRTGDTAKIDEAVTRLTLSDVEQQQLQAEGQDESTDKSTETPRQRPLELRWRSLALHGNLQPAMSILSAVDQADVVNLWLTLSRPEKAFASLETTTTEIDQNLHQWIDQAIKKQRDSSENALAAETQRLLSLMQVLTIVGRDDAAWLIASGLSSGHGNTVATEGAGELVSSAVLDGLSGVGRSDWAFKLAMQMDTPSDAGKGEDSISASRMAAIAGSLPETSEETLEVVLAAMKSMQPKWSFAKRLEAAGQLLRGKIPDKFDPQTDFRRFYEFVGRPRSTRNLAARFSRSATLRGNMQIVWMLSRLDQPDLSSSLLQLLAQSGDPDAILEIANRALDSGDLDSAEMIFQTIRESATLNGNRGVMFGGEKVHRIASYPSLTVTGKALVGQWIVAKSRRDEANANALKREIEVVLCGPSAALRRSVADALSKRGEKEWAAEVYEGMLASSWFSPEQSLDFYQDARRFALLASKTDPSSAARWFDLAMIQIIDSNQFLPTAFVTLPVYVHRWYLEAAIENGDPVQAEYRVNESLKLDPMDLDLTERLLPPMRDAGMHDLADQTLLKVLQRCESHAKEFPDDAMTLNNVAWVAAVNRKHLDRALKLSRQAVRTEPDSAIYRDTLAEILFLKNQPEQAIQIEQDCVLDDPGQWHLHEQIERFSKAL